MESNDYIVSKVSQSNYGTVTYAIKALERKLKAKEYYLKTTVNGNDYYTKLMVKPVQKLPTVTVKLDSFNPFYTDQYGKIKVEIFIGSVLYEN